METEFFLTLTQFGIADGVNSTFPLFNAGQVGVGAAITGLTINGVPQVAGVGYTQNQGATVTFASVPAAGSILAWTGTLQYTPALAPLWTTTVMSQFANSPSLLQLLSNFNGYIDPDADIANFLNDVWNINTAIGFGLDIWGRILGVSRILQVSSVTYFGLTGVTGRLNASGDSFGGGPAPTGAASFYAGASTTANYALSDGAFRVLLLAKALANITNGTPKAINQLLVNLFIASVPGRTGNAFVTDGLNMTMTYTFTVRPALTPVEVAIVSQSGVLPRPTGVVSSVVQI